MNRLERDNKIKTVTKFIKKQTQISDSLKAYYKIKELLRLLGENDFSPKLSNRLDNVYAIFHSMHKDITDELMVKDKENINMFIKEIE